MEKGFDMNLHIKTFFIEKLSLSYNFCWSHYKLQYELKRTKNSCWSIDLYNALIYLTTNTSQAAYLVILSETLPIKNRSTAFIPVAPQIIKSALNF